MNDYIQVKNLIYVINVAKDLVIRVNSTSSLSLNLILEFVLGSYSQHINQRNKYCRPDQIDTEYD